MNAPAEPPMPPARHGRTLSIVSLSALVLLTLAAGYLRTRQVDESLWIDELHTAWTADGALADVAPRAWIGNQSPLYFYLVWALARIFGMSELIVRLPSLAAGILLVPAACYVVVRWTQSWAAGLLAAVILAVDPIALYYSIEARPYALVQLAALAQVFVFSQLLTAKRQPEDTPAHDKPAHDKEHENRRKTKHSTLIGRRAALVLLSALLFYLHYTAALLLPAELAAFAIVRLGAWLWRRKRKAAGPPAYGWGLLAIDLALVALLWLPAAPHVMEIAGRRANWHDFIELTKLRDSPLWYPLTYAALWPALVLGAAVVSRWLFGCRPLLGRVSLSLAVLAVCWELVPAVLAWICTQADLARLFFPRYLNVSAPAAAGIAGMLAGWTEGRFARLLQLALIGGGTAYVFAHNFGPYYLETGIVLVHSQEDWRGAVAYINAENAKTARPVLVYSGLIEARGLSRQDRRLASYCLFPVTGIYKLRGSELPLIALPASGQVQLTHPQIVRIRSSGGIWLVVRNPPDQTAPFLKQTIEAVVHAGIPRERIVVPKPRRFGDVTVYRIDCPTR